MYLNLIEPLTRKHLSIGFRKNEDREFYLFRCEHGNLNVGAAYGYDQRLECGCIKRIEQERWRHAKFVVETNWQETMK